MSLYLVPYDLSISSTNQKLHQYHPLLFKVQTSLRICQWIGPFPRLLQKEQQLSQSSLMILGKFKIFNSQQVNWPSPSGPSDRIKSHRARSSNDSAAIWGQSDSNFYLMKQNGICFGTLALEVFQVLVRKCCSQQRPLSDTWKVEIKKFLPLLNVHLQGCISCGILVSGIRARGASPEHMENMEMFSCSPT